MDSVFSTADGRLDLSGGDLHAYMKSKMGAHGGFAKGVSTANLILTIASAIGGVVVSAYALEDAEALAKAQSKANSKLVQNKKDPVKNGDHKTLFTILLIISSIILALAVGEAGMRIFKRAKEEGKKVHAAH